MVPLLPCRIVSTAYAPSPSWCRTIKQALRHSFPPRALDAANRTAARYRAHRGRGQDPYLIHIVDGVEYQTKISTLRGDYRSPTEQLATAYGFGRSTTSNLGPTTSSRNGSTAIQWMRPKRTERDTNTSSAPSPRTTSSGSVSLRTSSPRTSRAGRPGLGTRHAD